MYLGTEFGNGQLRSGLAQTDQLFEGLPLNKIKVHINHISNVGDLFRTQSIVLDRDLPLVGRKREIVPGER